MAGHRPSQAGLQPLGQIGLSRQDLAEAKALERLQHLWPKTVTPLLAKHCQPLRIRRGLLLLGCWPAELISNLRLGAEAAWPQLQERLSRICGLTLHRLEVTPCDPPLPKPPPTPPVQDPLRALLEASRIRNSGWTRHRD